MAAGSIIVDLLMRTGSFITDTDRAKKKMQQFGRDLKEVGKAAGAAFAGVGVAAAAMVRQSIDAADAFAKLAQQAGVSVESISSLAYAADLSGVSQEELGASLVRISRGASEAARGTGEARKGFDALGISVKKADGTLKGSDQLLLEVAEKFERFEDGAEKSALAVNLFGKSGAQLIPLLNSGAEGIQELQAEAQKLGLTLDTSTAKAAEQFNDNLTRLDGVRKGLSNGIMRELLPTLNSLTNELVESSGGAQFLEQASRAASTGIKLLISTGILLGGTFKAAGEVLGGVGAAAMMLARGEFRGAFDTAKAVATDFVDNIEGTFSTIDRVWNAEAKAIEVNAPELGKKLAAPAIEADKQARKAIDEVTRMLRSLEREVATFGKSETQIKLFDLQVAGATPEQLAGARQLLEVLEQRKRAQEDLQVTAQAAAHSQQLLNEAQSDVSSLISANQALRDEVELIGKSATEKAALEQARIANAIAAKEEALAMAQVAGGSAAEIQALEQQIALLKQRSVLLGQRGVAEQLAEDAERAKDFAMQVGSSFQSAFENAVIEGERFRDVLKGIAKDLLRLVIRNQITGPLAQAIGGFDFGSLFAARANGGPVFAGDGYLVGERGPELFVPNTAGRVLPTEALRGGGRPDVNIQVVNNTGVQASARQETSPDGSIRVILDAVAGDIQAGGRVAGAMSSTFGLNRGAGTPRRTR